MQQDHSRRTGTYLPAEIALEMIQGREKHVAGFVFEAQACCAEAPAFPGTPAQRLHRPPPLTRWLGAP